MSIGLPGAAVGIRETEGRTQTWALPHGLILAVNPQGHHDFNDFWFLSSRGCFMVSPGILPEARPRPGCFWMPRTHGSAKACGNRAIKSWLLNKPGFLSSIVRGILIQFTLFPSDKKGTKQMVLWGTMVWPWAFQNGFLGGGGCWETEERNWKDWLS